MRPASSETGGQAIGAGPLSEVAALLKLALPILMTQLAQAAMSFTDTLMAGRYGDRDLAAVAIGSSLWFPVLLAMSGILMATTPLVAQAFGARRFGRIRHTIQQALWLALLVGMGASLLLTRAASLFDYLAVPETVSPIARGYLDAILWGLPAAAVYQVLRSSNEALHRTRPVMAVSLMALAANVLLNYLLIYGAWGLPALGGVGCGWATALVMWLQLIAIAVQSIASPAFARIRFWRRWSRPRLARQRELVALGIPIGFAIFIEASMFSLIALFLAPLGAQVVAGHQITLSFTTLVFMVPLSLSMALTIRTGFALGMGQPRQAQRTVRTGLALALLFATLSCTLMLTLTRQIAALYTPDPAVQAIAVGLIGLAAVFQFSDALQVSSAGALRGYRDTRVPLAAVFLAYWLVGLPLGYLLGMTDLLLPAQGARGFWIGLIGGLTVGGLLLWRRLQRIAERALTQAAG